MSAIESETYKVLFKTDLLELVLKKLEEIPVLNNPANDCKNIMGNTNMEEIKKDGLAVEKGSGGTKCCLSKIEKLAVLAKVALLQSTLVTKEHLSII